MTNSAFLESREIAYRQAARVFDYFVTGTAAVFFLVSTVTLDSQNRFAMVLDLVAVILFAMGLIAGLRKLEACTTILGTDYSIAVTRSQGSGLSVRDTDAILEDLGDTLEKLSYRAALIHRARNRCVVLGIIAIASSRVLEVALVG